MRGRGHFAVAALERGGGIGLRGGLPWGRVPGELAWFRLATHGRIVLVGRATREGLPPLPRRRVVVATRSTPAGSGWETTPDAAAFLAANEGVAVIGGAALYGATMGLVDRLLLTRVDADFGCDAWFPSLGEGWTRTGIEQARGDGPPPWAVEEWVPLSRP